MNQNAKWIVGAISLLILASGKALAFTLKPGAVLPDTPEMRFVLNVVSDVWQDYGFVAVVTSGTDGEHGDDSLHDAGLALDFRTKNLPLSVKRPMIDAVTRLLGSQYDVVFEDAGKDNEHLHIEFDPA